MRDFVLTFISKYKVADIEAAFIKAYIVSNHLEEYVVNHFLVEKLSAEVNQRLYDEVLLYKDMWTLQDLIFVFEILVDGDIKKATGTIYTPEYIVSHIFRDTVRQFKPYQKVIDPSCGCGAFLVYAAKAIKELTNLPITLIVEKCIYGVDINSQSIMQAQILLTLLIVAEHEDRVNIHFNLVCCDALRENIPMLLCGDKNSAFDYIIGNPPYVNTHEIDKTTASFLKETYTTTTTGVFNLFYAFVELGYSLLTRNGRLGYIVPNNFFVIEAAKPLRHFLQSTSCIESIIDFGCNVVFNPIKTYTAIIILTKKRNAALKFCKLKYCNDICAALENASFSVIQLSNLNCNSWHLLSNIDSENVKKIEKFGYNIGQAIHTGIATLADKLYMIEMDEIQPGYYEKKHNNTTFLIEKDIVRKLVKVSKVFDETSIKSSTLGIIFPYQYSDRLSQLCFENFQNNEEKVEPIDENVFSEKYPQAYRYFCAIKSELSKRDKGNKPIIPWYAFGRSQGLNGNGRKIFFPTFSKKPRFIIDESSTTLFCNGYALFVDETPYKNHIEAIKKILNSSLMQFYIESTSYSIEGDFKCYQKKYVKSFSIPAMSEEEILFLEQCNDAQQINEFLIGKYLLTEN